MLSFEPAHDPGLTLTSVGPTLVLTGGQDGIIRLLYRPTRKLIPTLLWSRPCHEGAVTAVCLSEPLRIGFSCGRDGKVILHENIVDDRVSGEGEEAGSWKTGKEDHSEVEEAKRGAKEVKIIKAVTAPPPPSSTTAISRAICRLTGEARCLWFDPLRQRLFIGGDSLRCLHLHQKPFSITTIPLIAPHPLVALAGTDSGNLLAMMSAVGSSSAAASSSGSSEGGVAVGVVSVHPDFLAQRQQHQQHQRQAQEQDVLPSSGDLSTSSPPSSFLPPAVFASHLAVKIQFQAPISPEMIKKESSAFRLCWASLPPRGTPDLSSLSGGSDETPKGNGESPPLRFSSSSSWKFLHTPELLLIPGKTDIHLYRFEPATVEPFLAHRIHRVGSFSDRRSTLEEASHSISATSASWSHYFAAVGYTLSPRRAICLVASPTAISTLKLDTVKLQTTLLSTQSFHNVDDIIEAQKKNAHGGGRRRQQPSLMAPPETTSSATTTNPSNAQETEIVEKHEIKGGKEGRGEDKSEVEKSQLATWRSAFTSASRITSVDICPKTGDVVVGISNGHITCLHGFGPRERKIEPSSSTLQHGDKPSLLQSSSEKKKDVKGQGKASEAVRRMALTSQDFEGSGKRPSSSSVSPPPPPLPVNHNTSSQAFQQSKENKSANLKRAEDFRSSNDIHLEEEEEEEEALLLGVRGKAKQKEKGSHSKTEKRSGSTSALSSSSSARSEEEGSEESFSSSSSSSGSSSAAEDFTEVVNDLAKANGGVPFDVSISPAPRPSRWRDKHQQKLAVAEATRELRVHPTATSIFLDDEADEALSDDVRKELREAEDMEDDASYSKGGGRDGFDRSEEEDRGLHSDEEVGGEDGWVKRRRSTSRAPVGKREDMNGYSPSSVSLVSLYSFQVGATPLTPVDAGGEDGQEADPFISSFMGISSSPTPRHAMGEKSSVFPLSMTSSSLPATSTVARELDMRRGSCYLAYNGVGYIHQMPQCTVIYFHDVSVPAVRLRETGQIIMGSLSPVGAGFVIALPLSEEEQQQSYTEESEEEEGRGVGEGRRRGRAASLLLYYRSFSAVGAQSEWRLPLPPGESVRAIAVGIHCLAVATTRYLRMYSTSGLELAVLSKYTHIVTLLGMGSQHLFQQSFFHHPTAATGGGGGFASSVDPIVVVYMERSGEHFFEVLDVSNRTSLLSSPQPLVLTPAEDDSPPHQLQWIGWSDDGPLHTMDTAGIVRMYTKSWGGAWVPVYEPGTSEQLLRSAPGRGLETSGLKKGGKDLLSVSLRRRHPRHRTYLWVWGVSDEQLFAYRCPKSLLYPVATAEGLPVEHFPLLLPLSKHPLTDSSCAMWESLLRREIRTDELKQRSAFYTAALAKRDATHDDVLMKLFDIALENQHTTRAMDLCQRLELRDNIETCAKRANKVGQAQLTRRLLGVLEHRIKSKLKRRCTLPLEGTAVNEKEKDWLLRRLLAKEKKQDPKGKQGGVCDVEDRKEENGVNGVKEEIKGIPLSAASPSSFVSRSEDVTLCGPPPVDLQEKRKKEEERPPLPERGVEWNEEKQEKKEITAPLSLPPSSMCPLFPSVLPSLLGPTVSSSATSTSSLASAGTKGKSGTLKRRSLLLASATGGVRGRSIGDNVQEEGRNLQDKQGASSLGLSPTSSSTNYSASGMAPAKVKPVNPFATKASSLSLTTAAAPPVGGGLHPSVRSSPSATTSLPPSSLSSSTVTPSRASFSIVAPLKGTASSSSVSSALSTAPWSSPCNPTPITSARTITTIRRMTEMDNTHSAKENGSHSAPEKDDVHPSTVSSSSLSGSPFPANERMMTTLPANPTITATPSRPSSIASSLAHPQGMGATNETRANTFLPHAVSSSIPPSSSSLVSASSFYANVSGDERVSTVPGIAGEEEDIEKRTHIEEGDLWKEKKRVAMEEEDAAAAGVFPPPTPTFMESLRKRLREEEEEEENEGDLPRISIPRVGV